MNSKNEAVSWKQDGEVLVVTIDNPPVNALSAAVRRGLMAAMDAAQSAPAVRAVVITGAGKHFMAGADIREFGLPLEQPSGSAVVQRLESSDKLVVAALHGAVLGGGLELALGAHYRVVAGSAKLGLPEVNLGLLPGGGGTQRAPRLVGAGPALDLMLSGRHIGAQEALTIGLVDRVSEQTDARSVGLAYARELLAANALVRRSRDAGALADRQASLAQVEAARERFARKNRGLLAPEKIIEAVVAAIEQPFDAGKALESELFAQCVDSPQRAGLVHAFFAEREVAKIPEAGGATPRRIDAVAVVGGGTMGAGIAVSVLDAGLHVTMVEREAKSLATGRANVEKVYDGLIGKGRMTAADKASVLARYAGTTSYDDIGQVDLVIEAVFEDMAVKHAVFAELDRVCKPGAILATNTSTLDINAIAAATSRPQDVIGLHFFSPANVMRLLEIVVPDAASTEVVATAFDFAERLRKVAVRAGVCDGFIGNRILAVYRQVVDFLMEDGASPYEIDEAVRAFGYPMGPLQVADLAGGDIGWATRKRRAATRDPNARYVRIADRICENGWFGQKTGRGFYLYPQGSRTGQPDPEVLRIVDEERARAGVTPRSFSGDEIMRRYMAAMVNEGANVIQEGIALRPLDVDAVFLFGYGFPRHRGGPMKWADMTGLDKVLADIEEFATEDPVFWKPSPLLRQLVADNKTFDSLNHAR